MDMAVTSCPIEGAQRESAAGHETSGFNVRGVQSEGKWPDCLSGLDGPQTVRTSSEDLNSRSHTDLLSFNENLINN